MSSYGPPRNYRGALESSERAAPVRAPLDVLPHLDDSASQSRYHTRRASATPVAPTQIPLRGPPTKKAKTSKPGESSRAPRDSQSQPAIPSDALDPARLLRATQIAGPNHFMPRHILSTLCCASRLTCGIHTAYFRVYDYSWRPGTSLDTFTIDGRQGILGARQIAEAFHIPYAPADPTAFRRWAPLSEWDMVRSLSRGTSSQRTIFRRELPPGMLLVDVVLRTNLFPLQHTVQRRGAILEALFRIFEGYYFGPHHLIMVALLHFEEKVHKRRLTRAASIQLLFPRLLCHVLAHMGFPADPQAEPRRHCRESFSLDQWTQLSLHQHSPELPEPREVPPTPSTSAPSEPVPQAASSDAPLLFLLPQSRPSLSLVQSTVPCSLLFRL
ncbi:hypothetical protein CK203_046355 [Vitis vinifera]|uniref:Uncharacterized protein n=1 Tax=Vitis vinifera TaxID=29760 RepID=A0A438FW64_VITVI|nr:hypothetical protein CK203_046355 [Vitis vinifera]